MRVLYRVESLDSEDLGPPVDLDQAVDQVRKRVQKELEGPLKVMRVEYELTPESPPTLHTKADLKVWRGTVVRFPDIGTKGTFACKPDSQHRFGNATDWSSAKDLTTTDDIVSYLWVVARWLRRQGVMFEDSSGDEGLPVSEVIFRDRISTRAHDWTWRKHTGQFHASHVHSSCHPLINTSRPCGEVS